MRLTELYTDLEIEINNTEPEARHLEKGDFRPKNNALLSDCVQKLGQLEDIEEELGIDLITLFKALKNGFYNAKFKDLFEYGIKTNSEWACSCLDLDNKRFYAKATFEGPEIIVKFSDYGKTWALTKEELEK